MTRPFVGFVAGVVVDVDGKGHQSIIPSYQLPGLAADQKNIDVKVAANRTSAFDRSPRARRGLPHLLARCSLVIRLFILRNSLLLRKGEGGETWEDRALGRSSRALAQ
jgi:hypothetical protein